MTEAQPGWFKQHWRWLVGGGCLTLALCCGGSMVVPALLGAAVLPSARVDCGTPGPDGVSCTIARTEGTLGLQACWDLEITCQNGGLMRGHACGSLQEGAAQGSVVMPVSAFSDQDTCDAPRAGAVKNLEVSAQ